MTRRLLAALLLLAASRLPAEAALLNVRDYPSPAAAIEAAKDGDRIYFPSPGPYLAPPGGWKISKSLEIFGDGVGNGTRTSGSALVARAGAGNNVFFLDASSQTLYNISFRDLFLVSPDTASGDAIHAVINDATHKIAGLRFDAVTCRGPFANGIHIDGGAQQAILLVRIADCEANSCAGNGLDIRNCTTTYVLGGFYHGCRHFGIYAENSFGIRLIGTALEENQTAGTSSDYDAQLRLKLTHAFTVIGCHFEDFSQAGRAAKTAISVENCRGGQISTSGFGNNGQGVSGSRGIFIQGGSQNIEVGVNTWSMVDTTVSIRSSDASGCVVQPQNKYKTDARAAGSIAIPSAAADRHVIYGDGQPGGKPGGP